MQYCARGWTRRSHTRFSEHTNALFATLLLGVQRLEEVGLPLAHQAMLEEMLECWTGPNDSAVSGNAGPRVVF